MLPDSKELWVAIKNNFFKSLWWWNAYAYTLYNLQYKDSAMHLGVSYFNAYWISKRNFF